MDVAITFGAYGLGAVVGVMVHRGGPWLRHRWPTYLRAQLVITAALLGLSSAWRLHALDQVLAPLLLAAPGWLVLAVSLATDRSRNRGMACLDAWATCPNGSFWVQPIAGAVGGPAASAINALTNAVYAVSNGVYIHVMRRDAEVPQRRVTTWADQSMVLAVGIGLVLHLAGPAPPVSRWVLLVAGPILAFVGAAMFTGSILHPHNAAVERTSADLRRWCILTASRVAYLLVVALLTRSSAVAVIAVLSALGPPTFTPPQLAVVYGYRSGVVSFSSRWGWLLLPAGLAGALVVR